MNESTASASPLSPSPVDRALRFQQLFNVRDLGGLPAADGTSIRRGRLLRGEDAHLAAAEDVSALQKLGLQQTIDLRTAPEVDTRGTATWDALEVRRRHHPWWVSVPPISEAHRYLTPEATAKLYAAQHLESLASQAQVWAALADASAHPTMLHCASGRDRTGIVVAILLSALGVPTEYILSDYAHSAHGMRRMLTHLENTHTPDELAALELNPDAMVLTPSEAIELFLAWLTQHHGGIDEYFHSIDATGPLEQLRANLVTRP